MPTKPTAVQMQPKTVKPKTKQCFVCGPENPHGLHIPFFPDGPHGSRAQYTARAEHGGWPGILHGGITLALMDEALGWAVYFQGLNGVTARSETRFRQLVPTGAKLIIRGWTIQQRRRAITARAEIRTDDEDQVLLAETDATMFLLETEPESKG